MRMSIIAALLVIAFGAPWAAARPWTDAQIADLRVAALASADQGLPVPESRLARLALAEDLYRVDEMYVGELDRAADDLFSHLASSYARGGVDPASVGADWHIDRPQPPNLDVLYAALDGGWPPRIILQSLQPQGAEYRALQEELARLLGGADRDDSQVAQLRANLERWRWLPRELAATRIEVRIAEYELELHRDSQPSVRRAVIVGARRTPSPVLQADAVTVTLNPDWTPPQSIVANELLPRFRRNPSAAAQEGFDVIDASGHVVDPSLVDWSARPFPYQLRQRPGPDNALGRVRFDLPNRFSVFLHDTPNRRLFARDQRALSHGCIRVQDPVQLAATMLEMEEASVQQLIDAGNQQALPLAPPIPVYVLYLTTAVGADGSIRYLDDIYRRDAAIVGALDAGPFTLAATETRAGQCSP